MTARARTGRSRQAIEAKREKLAALKDQLAEYEDQITDEERAAILSRFQGYSDRNACLIAMQCPDATEVAGYRAWADRGRQVRKGEQGIQILAPAGTSADKVETETTQPGDDGEEVRQFFKIAHVFDIAQTDPISETTGEAA